MADMTVIEGLYVALYTFRQLADAENPTLSGFASAAEVLTSVLIDNFNTVEEN